MKLNSDLKIHNRFDVEVIDSITGELKQKAVAYNVICDNLYTRRLNNSENYFAYIAYGSGSGTPSASDTSLFSTSGYGAATTHSSSIDRPNGIYQVTRKTQLSESTAVGVTLTEVGISSSNTTGRLCTHAMLEDMNGNPISILKTNTDIITIYATIYIHFPSNGPIYIYNTRILDYFAGIDGNISSTLFCFSGRGTSIVNRTSYDGNYNVPGGKRIDGSVTKNVSERSLTLNYNRLTISDYNTVGGVNGIHSFLAWPYSTSSGGSYTYYPYNSGIFAKVDQSWYDGSDIVSESIGIGDGITKDFKTHFNWITNGNIYVNGAIQSSGAHIDLNQPANRKEYGYELNSLDSSGNIIINPAMADYKDERAGSWSYNIYHLEQGSVLYFENPNYENWGIRLWRLYKDTRYYDWKVYCSDDFITWNLATDGATGPTGYNDVEVPNEYRKARYWKFENNGSSSMDIGNADGIGIIFGDFTDYNIHFDEAPAEGDIITCSYHTQSIAKDANHVFDLSLTVQLGEYTPPNEGGDT